MLLAFPFSFNSLWLLIAAAFIALSATWIVYSRRPNLPPTALWIALAGVICLVIAAGRPVWHRPAERSVAVMIDLSPSTRGATFRDSTFLSRRLRDLLGKLPYHLWAFSGGPAVEFPPTLDEMPTDQTKFLPVDADAIVLFSDCQFDLPNWSPPVYVVVDPNLEQPGDAKVDGLQIDGNQLKATFSNTGNPRVAVFEGTTGVPDAPVQPGSSGITRILSPGATSASVELNNNDLWPENDSMSMQNSPQFAGESWWVGSRSVATDQNQTPSNWKSMYPGLLPHVPDRYLAPAVIVLDNISPQDLSPEVTDNLTQYVRDLGGSLLILGGDRAFTVGGYIGTPLDDLSPLSSSPPRPALRWMILVDSSGSMAADTAGTTRWLAASTAAVRLLPQLPPLDLVQIGQFSADLKWWSTNQNAAATAQLSLPPADAAPIGPTDLEAALDHIASETNSALPTRLLILTDCDVQISQPSQLTELLRSKNIQLSVLAIAHGGGFDTVSQIAAATGGTVIEQDDSTHWFSTLSQLSRSVLPQTLMQTPIMLRSVDDPRFGDSQSLQTWNRTWLKEHARMITQAMYQDQPMPIVATWQYGRGTVTSVAFSPDAQPAMDLATQVALKPRDPRYSVKWTTGPTITASIVAADAGKPLNDLQFKLELTDDSGTRSVLVNQTGPGQYAGSLLASRQTAIATLSCGQTVVDRIAVPGCYAPEFDNIANNHDLMNRLADQSGGAVIWPGNDVKLDFHWPPKEVPLSATFSGIAAALIAVALLRCRQD
jgi:VWA domain-containing protein